MRKAKKVLVLLMSLLILSSFGLAACDRGGPSGGGNYVGTLRIGFYRAGYGDFVTPMAEAYNRAHPDEQINFIVDDTVDALFIKSKLETGAEDFDLYYVMQSGWADYAAKGYLAPLDDLMDMTNEDGNKYSEVLREEYTNYGVLNGKRYLVPQSGASAGGFAYNEVMFNQYGWEAPTTLDELRDLVDKINALPCNTDSDPDNNIAPFAWGGSVAGMWNAAVWSWWGQYDGQEALEEFYAMETVDVFKPENRQGLEKALEIFQEFSCSGEGTPINALDGCMSKNHLTMQRDFVMGKAAMQAGVYGLVNETKEIIDPEKTVLRFFYAPFVDGAKVDEETGEPIKISVNLGQDFAYVPAKSHNIDLAKKFILWTSTQDMCRLYSQSTAFPAPYYADYSNIEGADKITQDILDATQEAVIVGYTNTTNPISNQERLNIWTGTGDPYQDMVLNNTSPKTVLQRCYDYVNTDEIWGAYWEEFFGEGSGE